MNYASHMISNKSYDTMIKEPRYSLVTAVFLYAIILLKDIGTINISPYLIVTICVLAFIALSVNDTIKILFFLLPFSGGVLIHTIVLSALICWFIKIMAVGEIDKKAVFYLFPGIMMGLFNMITGGPSEDLRTAILIVTYFSIVSLLVYYADFLDVASIIKYFIAGTMLSFINVIYMTLSMYSVDMIRTYGIRFGYARGGNIFLTSFDPNTMGLFALLGLSLVYLLYRSKHLPLLSSIMLMVFFIIGGAFSISRTYLILQLLLLMYMFLHNANYINGRKILGFMIFSAMLVSFYVFFINDSSLFNYTIQRYVERFSVNSSRFQGGRYEIFVHYLRTYFSSLKLFFVGAGINGYKNYGSSAHNGFQEIFLAWGAIGSMIVFPWLTTLIRTISLKRDRQMGIDLWIPLVFFLLYIQTLQWFSIYIYILLFCIALLAMNVKRAENV